MTLISITKRAAEVMMLVKSNGGEQRNSGELMYPRNMVRLFVSFCNAIVEYFEY